MPRTKQSARKNLAARRPIPFHRRAIGSISIPLIRRANPVEIIDLTNDAPVIIDLTNDGPVIIDLT